MSNNIVEDVLLLPVIAAGVVTAANWKSRTIEIRTRVDYANPRRTRQSI